MNVFVIDLGVGNICSLTSALTYLGASHVVTADADAIESATHVILPGVGAYDPAMNKIHEYSLTEPLHKSAIGDGKPLLGVCLGMQLLFEGSEEGCMSGLALMPGRFTRLVSNPHLRQKVPHVGFSLVNGYRETGLFKGLGMQSHFYFTHSYALPVLEGGGNIAVCDHGQSFVAAFQMGNICGVQFHPEKSQSSGLRLLSNFLELSSQ